MMRQKYNDRRPGFRISENGFALVIVIVVMLLVSFLASQLIMQVRTELQIAFNAKTRAASHFLSEAGVNLALFRLLDKPFFSPGNEEIDEFSDFIEGYPYETVLPNGRIRYYAVTEAGKMDLNDLRNPAKRRLLELFFEYHQVEPAQSDIIIDSLTDWADPNDLVSLNGAERETYRQLEDPYEPRNGKILEPAEFFLVNGTDVLAGRFDPAEVFTIHNPAGRVNFNSLTPAMLDFLVEGDPVKKEAYLRAQEENYGQLRAVAREILGDERFAMVSPYLIYSVNQNKTGYYFIEAAGWTDYGPQGPDPDREASGRQQGPGTKITALVKLGGNGFRYIYWKEDPT